MINRSYGIKPTDQYSDHKYNGYSAVKRPKRGDLSNVSSTSNPMEPDRTTESGTDQQQRATNGNADGSGQPSGVAGTASQRPDGTGTMQRNGGAGVSNNDGQRSGANSTTSLSDGSKQHRAGTGTHANDGGGSGSDRVKRSSAVKRRDRSVVQSATQDRSAKSLKEQAQQAADKTPTTWADANNIATALPYLLPEQRDDVLKTEQRLIEQNKAGILFTNGTGTGKTFTGLGNVKRFVNAGKRNILIVTLSDKIARDFVKSGSPLNLDVRQLAGVDDGHQGGIVVTTYANLAQNSALGKVDWDCIVVDEAHTLMQSQQGDATNALKKLRALSGHHAGFDEWAKMRHAEQVPVSTGTNEHGFPEYNQDDLTKWQNFKAPLRDIWQKDWENQTQKTKVIFLSATPFSYVQTLDWAEGYLFNFKEPKAQYSTDDSGGGYNSGNARDNFYITNFGYRMRYNRLTQPDARVDVGVMERQFAEKLKKEGAVSGRSLVVPFDYDRKFVLINSPIGEAIDEGMRYLQETKDKDGYSIYGNLSSYVSNAFNYIKRAQLLEAIKADAAIAMIKQHIALGRKVLVFHDYNSGGLTNPFELDESLVEDRATRSEHSRLTTDRPDLFELDMNLPSPIKRLKEAFPDLLQFNGTLSKGERSKNADLFNSDTSGHNVLIVQSDAGSTGISFHDTTANFQRVLINIGMPAKPAKLRQTEGRTYRVGQASNAIYRYLTTGTDWERTAFASKIAERAETVDNLSQGEDAVVSIKDALVRAYEMADDAEPSVEDGIGGKAYDEENSRVQSLSPFERAKTHYWSKAKVTANRTERMGKEWYATPEPIGLKMVQWSGARKGDDVLEPSAGDGAIGRYMPADASVTFIEPSEALASRAMMNNTNAKVIISNFEDHNIANKYDSIVMNPPFGNGGSTAIKHISQAALHLRNNGRLVALLPTGQMDKRLDDAKQQRLLNGLYMVAKIALPSCAFANAGTSVNTQVIIWQKHDSETQAPTTVERYDLSHIKDINELFDRIEKIKMPVRPPRLDEELAQYGLAVYPDRNKYIITGVGLKNEKIRDVIAYYARLENGDYVDRINRSAVFLKMIKQDPSIQPIRENLIAFNEQAAA